MKRILCLVLCVLLLLSGCTAGTKDNMTDPTGTTAGETTVNTETSANVADSDTTGSTEGDDEWEEVYEEFDGSGNSSDSQGGTSSSSSGSDAKPETQGSGEITGDGTIHYYFMAGEGQIFSNGDYCTKWGDSCLIVFPNGQTMLIDTGMQKYYPSLKQKLHSLGVYDLDYLVLSHPHDDHCGGIWAGLFKDFKIGQVYHNGVINSGWGASAHVETICEKNNVPCGVLKKGDTLKIGSGSGVVTIRVLWPTEEAKNVYGKMKGSGPINCQSLVMRFDFGEHSSLFTGDLYKTYKGVSEADEQTNGYQISGQAGAEEWIASVYTNGELDVDLLKMPHHGDPSTSNSAEFFAATTPKLAIATGFLPVESGYLSVYKSRGYSGPVLFDRKYGYIHVYATADGTMKYDTSRSDYLPDYGRTWNTALERK